MKIALLLAVIAALRSSEAPSNQTATAAKLMLNVKASELDTLLKSVPFAVVLFNRAKTAKGKENLRIFKSLHDAFKEHDLVFVQVRLVRDTPQMNQMYVYVNQIQKHYAGMWSYEALQNWLYEIYFARPRQKSTFKDIDSIDSHYFVYVNEDYRTQNEDYVRQLAKLLNPLSIVYGLEEAELSGLLHGRKPASPLWIYREYGDEIIEVDLNAPTQAVVDFIVRNEFPDFIAPDAKSLRLLLEFKVPTLLYYTNDPRAEFVDALKELLKPHKEYLILTIVDITKKNRETRFLMNFMGVDKAPAIRILNMSDAIRRYKFIGKAQPLLISNFITNYIAGNLEPYNVSERLKSGEKIGGIPKGNYKSFQRAVKDIEIARLVYVYGASVRDNKKNLATLSQLQDALGGNLHFELLAINHDKNDLDGYYNDALPFLFLATRRNAVEHYDGEISYDKLLEFVLKHFPYFRVTVSTEL